MKTMAEAEKKGLTVKIDADLHAEVRKYLDAHEMTMAEFVTMALKDELHPKNMMKEGTTMPSREHLPSLTIITATVNPILL